MHEDGMTAKSWWWAELADFFDKAFTVLYELPTTRMFDTLEYLGLAKISKTTLCLYIAQQEQLRHKLTSQPCKLFAASQPRSLAALRRCPVYKL